MTRQMVGVGFAKSPESLSFKKEERKRTKDCLIDTKGLGACVVIEPKKAGSGRERKEHGGAQ